MPGAVRPPRDGVLIAGTATQSKEERNEWLFFEFTVTQYDVGTLVLRVVFGVLLGTHGYPKLTSGYKGTMDWLASKRIPRILGPLIGILEFVGGFFIVIGFLTPFVAALLVIQFLGMVLNGKRLGKSKLADYEKDLLYLGGAFALIFLGGGSYSLDHFLGL